MGYNMAMRERICFIIPKHRSSTATHFNYLYKLIALLDKEQDLFLIVERGDKPDFLENKRVYVQKFKILPLKLIENFLIILYVRITGYRDFYIHYSFLSAMNSSLVARVSSGRTFYWNCGLPWLYHRSFSRDKFERLIYKLITFLVTGTPGLKKMYAKHYHLPLGKIKVMPNWVDISRFKDRSASSNALKQKLGISEGVKIILFVHHLSRRKGAHYLPKIAESLKNEKAVLLIAGGGPDRKRVESEISKLGIGDKTRFLNCIPNNEIQNYFAITDVFILPSEEEGFPHVLLEAMAAGVPFVAFDVGGVREIIPAVMNNYIAGAGDIEQFFDKIKELLNKKPEELKLIKTSLINWVMRYDISNSVKEFINLIYG